MSVKIKELVPVFTKEQLEQRVSEVGAQISRDYAGKDMVAICVLKGAMIFFTDLIRHIDNERLSIDCIQVSSYGNGVNAGQVHFKKDIDCDVTGKDVLIVEDIIDTGLSMHKILEHFKNRGARSVKLCACIDKNERRQVPVTVDYSCFSLDKGFIVGYGLDVGEKYRQLPQIDEVILEND